MLRKPHWTLGLELAPHHFQSQDRYHEELIARRLDALFDYAWGVHEIEWDLRAMASGRLALRRLDAVLPDGTPIEWRETDGGANPAVTLRDLGPKNALEVYAGIRRLRPGANVDSDDVGGTPRYVKDSVLAADLAGATDPIRLEFLRPNLQLVLEGPSLQEFDAVPCARVIRTAAGPLTLDDRFLPPLLSVSASPYLEGELRRTLADLATRQAALKKTTARDATEAVQRWIASLFGSFSARLADVLQQRRAHPLHAYRILAELLGALAAFTRQGQYRVPPFDYEHLGPVFSELLGNVAVVLDALSAEQHRRIALQRVDATTLFAELNEPTIFRNDFYLGVSGADVDALRVQVPRHFKVAAWSDLAVVVRSATAGVPLQPVPRPPATLPADGGHLYFRLEKTAAFTPIYKTGQIGIYHGGSSGLADVSLFAVDPDAT